MIQPTSIETYLEIKESGLLSEKRMKVYEIFYENPNGLTGSQVSEIYKSRYYSSKHSETIRNRITELRDMGCLTELGLVKCEYTQRMVMRFTTTDNLPKSLEKKLTLQEKTISILKDLAEIGLLINDDSLKNKLREVYKKVKTIKN